MNQGTEAYPMPRVTIWGKRKPTDTAAALFTGPLENAFAHWYEHKYELMVPRPEVKILGPGGLFTANIDTTKAPWQSPPEHTPELSDDHRSLFMALTKGQYDNFVMMPGIFAGQPSSYIALVQPLAAGLSPDEITPDTPVKHIPVFVQVNAASATFIEQITGVDQGKMAPLEEDEDVKLRRKKLEPVREARERDKAAGGRSTEKQQEMNLGPVPMATGTIVDIRDRMKKGEE